MEDLIKRIQSSLPEFSKGQKLIARYITENYDKAAFMTASKLGATVGVSESTVVRFAAELGYEGYPKLQKTLQEMIRNRLTSVQRMEVTSDNLGNRDVLHMALHSDIDKIKVTLDEIDKEMFGEAVEAILAARKIYILGIRSSASLAGFLGFYFNLLFDNAHLVQTASVGELFEQIFRVGEGDVVIGISFPRYSKRTVKALQYAHAQNARIIAITDSSISPLVPLADYVLLAKSGMTSFVDSLVAPLSVINALIAAIGMRKKDEMAQTFHALEDIWEEYQVYEKTDNS